AAERSARHGGSRSLRRRRSARSGHDPESARADVRQALRPEPAPTRLQPRGWRRLRTGRQRPGEPEPYGWRPQAAGPVADLGGLHRRGCVPSKEQGWSRWWWWGWWRQPWRWRVRRRWLRRRRAARSLIACGALCAREKLRRAQRLWKGLAEPAAL